ncbi:unnamed protein product [Toxocara canis]|uniref:BRCT domain-containing protein n=1 Tax=Toxocara canis TaxID=6265 RepID=A0A183UEV3_TOXCA|nr:unnamed protein product [Toxocara canis]
METDTSSDAEKQQRRRSVVFIGVAESCDLPHPRRERDVESVAEILNELNVDGVPVEVYRMGVFSPAKRRPIKVMVKLPVSSPRSYRYFKRGDWVTANAVLSSIDWNMYILDCSDILVQCFAL